MFTVNLIYHDQLTDIIGSNPTAYKQLEKAEEAKKTRSYYLNLLKEQTECHKLETSKIKKCVSFSEICSSIIDWIKSGTRVPEEFIENVEAKIERSIADIVVSKETEPLAEVPLQLYLLIKRLKGASILEAYAKVGQLAAKHLPSESQAEVEQENPLDEAIRVAMEMIKDLN